jgi:hypothetical protein
VIEGVFGFSAWLLTAAMSIGFAVWFCSSIVAGLIKIRRRHQTARHDALSKEKVRLKRLLADAEQQTAYFRKQLYYSDSGRARRRSYDVRHLAA